jgi:hypothetical protein
MDTQAHRANVQLGPLAAGRLAGARALAVPARHRAEKILASGREVVFDFAGIEVTQSFVDELVGHLILRDGPDVLDRIVFKSCSSDTRAIIEFVVADRADQYFKAHSH